MAGQRYVYVITTPRVCLTLNYVYNTILQAKNYEDYDECSRTLYTNKVYYNTGTLCTPVYFMFDLNNSAILNSNVTSAIP